MRRSPCPQWLLLWLFPALRAWPAGEWREAMGQARTVEFDRVERLGLLAAVVFVSWLLQSAVRGGEEVSFVFFSQLAYAVPLVLLTTAPFYFRRLRRGLELGAAARRTAPAVRPEGR